MHELSVVDALIGQVRGEVERSGHSGRITRVELVIGRLSGVNVDSFRFAYEMLSPGTLLDTAELAISEPRAICHCHGCGARSEIDDLLALCPKCQSDNLSVEGGQELLLQSIELENGPSVPSL